MKFFIDTADPDEVRQASDLGLVDGVTTNPSLVAKMGRSYRGLIEEICRLTEGPVSAEVLATDYQGMMDEARQWVGLSRQVVVKLPLTSEGLKVTAACSKEGIRTNVTLCFNGIQGLLAARAGATYVSPFVGRLEDIGHDGLEVVREIRAVYDRYQVKTRLLVASVRGKAHIRASALIGADAITIPYKVIGQLVGHPLTSGGLEQFSSDAEKIPLA